MNKKLVLFVTGIIPILFLIPAIYYFTKDNRNDLMKQAKLINQTNLSELKLNELVKFDAKISTKNKIQKDNFSILIDEKYIKGDGSKKPFWKFEKSYHEKIILDFDIAEILIQLSNDYVPCGDNVEVFNLKPKISRTLGIKNGELVSALGEVISLNPIIIDTKQSLCTGTLQSFDEYWNRRILSYSLIGIFIFLPSIGILYIALRKGQNGNTG